MDFSSNARMEGPGHGHGQGHGHGHESKPNGRWRGRQHGKGKHNQAQAQSGHQPVPGPSSSTGGEKAGAGSGVGSSHFNHPPRMEANLKRSLSGPPRTARAGTGAPSGLNTSPSLSMNPFVPVVLPSPIALPAYAHMYTLQQQHMMASASSASASSSTSGSRTSSAHASPDLRESGASIFYETTSARERGLRAAAATAASGPFGHGLNTALAYSSGLASGSASPAMSPSTQMNFQRYDQHSISSSHDQSNESSRSRSRPESPMQFPGPARILSRRQSKLPESFDQAPEASPSQLVQEQVASIPTSRRSHAHTHSTATITAATPPPISPQHEHASTSSTTGSPSVSCTATSASSLYAPSSVSRSTSPPPPGDSLGKAQHDPRDDPLMTDNVTEDMDRLVLSDPGVHESRPQTTVESSLDVSSLNAAPAELADQDQSISEERSMPIAADMSIAQGDE